nr:hypothetical protein [Tanacetum cinerariifolium]
MQTQEDHSNLVPALNVDSLKVDLVVIQNTCSEKENSNLETASSKSVKKSSLDSATKDVHAIKYKMSKAKERCMTYFQSLHSHLQVLSKEDLKEQLQKQLDKEDFQEDGSKEAFWYDQRVNKRQMQKRESKIDTGKAVDEDLVVTKSSERKSKVQDDNSRLGNDTDADDAYIRPIYDEEPMVEVQLTAKVISLL